MSFRRAAATFIALAAALLFRGGGPSRAAAPDGGGAPTSAVNPHWDAARCGECHPAGSPPSSLPIVDTDRVCLRCHDGRSASAEAHPTGRHVPKDRTLPAGWPLADGRLSCLTCHDVRKACSPAAERNDSNANLLRGDAPARRGTAGGEFCGHCHAPAESAKLNPHAMLTADRQAITGRCLACHSAPPDRNARARTGQPALRAGEIQICRSCHLVHKDQFNPGHLGAPVKPDMLAFIRAREVVGLAAPPGATLVAQLKAAGEKPTLMPLSADGTITCTTCHNPHQAGVFPPGTPLAYRPMRVAGGRATSPVRGDQWCNHCHDL